MMVMVVVVVSCRSSMGSGEKVTVLEGNRVQVHVRRRV